MFSRCHKISLIKSLFSSNQLSKSLFVNFTKKLYSSKSVRNESYEDRFSEQFKQKISIDEVQNIVSNKAFTDSEKQLFDVINSQSLEALKENNFDLLRSNYALDLIRNLDLDDLDYKSLENSLSGFSLEQDLERILRIKTVDEYLKYTTGNLEYSVAFMKLLLTSLLTLRATDPQNAVLIQFCEESLIKTVQSLSLRVETLDERESYKLKRAFIHYFMSKKDSRVRQKVCVEIESLFQTCLKSSTDFNKDYKFHLKALKSLFNTYSRKRPDSNQLESYEIPFLNETENSTKKQRETTVHNTAIANLDQIIKTNIIENLQSSKGTLSLVDFNTCLEVIQLVEPVTTKSIESAFDVLRDVLASDTTQDPETLIAICFNLSSLMKKNIYFYRERIKDDLKLIFDRLADSKLSKGNAIQVYSIFRTTQTMHQRLLQNIESILKPIQSELNKGAFLNLLFFYSSAPKSQQSDEFYSNREISINVKKNLRHFTFENIMDLIIACVQLNFEGKVKSVDYLPTLDGESWSLIFSILLETKVDRLTALEKLKYFRVLKILSLIVEENVFSSMPIQDKTLVLAKNFSVHATRIESEFQKEVEEVLKDYTKAYETERLIQDLFSVDFLVVDTKVLEVNGPTHYYIIYSEDKVEYCENKSTEMKRLLLEALEYKYFAVPFYDWFTLDDPEEKKYYIIDKLKGRSSPY